MLGQECERIELSQGRVSGVRLQSGDSLRADSVVFNGDIAALRQGLLGSGVKAAVAGKKQARSLSAVTWSMHTPSSGLALDRHNVFFRSNYSQEFEAIFQQAKLPSQPTVYVCAQDRGTGEPVNGAERLLCLVNAPANGDKRSFTPQELADCTASSQDLLARCGLSLQLEPSSSCIRTTPQDFHQLFPATGGALYGQATHGWMAAFARSNAKAQVPGLYLAGAACIRARGADGGHVGPTGGRGPDGQPRFDQIVQSGATSGGTLTH